MTTSPYRGRILAGLTLCAAATVSPLSAANGDIPIYQATTIAAPGRYVVTRDITAQGDVIVLQTGGVSLDLNGHTLRSVTGSGVVLDITGIPADPSVTVANGRIVGGETGIKGINLPAVLVAVVDKVGIVMPMFDCVSLHDGRLEVRGSVLSECGRDGIRMDGGGLVEVQDTLITDVRGSGVFAADAAGVTVRESTIRRFGADAGVYGQAGVWVTAPGKVGLSVLDSVLCDGSTMAPGIRLWLTGSVAPIRIVGNQIGGNGGSGIEVSGGAAHITGNTIHQNLFDGIRVDAAGIVTPSMISGNSILKNSLNGTSILHGAVRFNGNTVGGNLLDGVSVAGERALVESNFLEGNGGAGLRFLNGTGHAYRSNFLRGNTGGDVDDPFGNTDGGGNIK